MKKTLTALFLGVISLQAVANTYDPNQSAPGVTPVLPSAATQPGQVAGGVSLLLNGGMESNGGVGTSTISDWTLTTVDGSSGTTSSGAWVVYSGTSAPISTNVIEAPTEGTFGAVSDTGGPTANVMYQDIAIPANGADLSCDVFFLNQFNTNINTGSLDLDVGPNQHARVDIMDPAAAVDDTGAGVLQNLWITDDADPTSFSYFALTANLNAFAGQTVRLRFAEVNNQFFQNLAVDNCSVIEGTPPAAVPALSLWSLLALMLSVLLIFAYRTRQQH